MRTTPISSPSGPSQWLFQGPPAESKFLAALPKHRYPKHRNTSSVPFSPATPISPPSGPSQWLFQKAPAKSKFLATRALASVPARLALFLAALVPLCAAELKVATCQFPVSGDVSVNAGWIRRQLEEARAQGADIVHFSETALSGYAGVDLPSLAGYPWDRHRAEFDSILAAARRLQLWVVLGAHHRLSGDHRPHNSLYVIDPTGAIVDRYDKRFCTTGDLKHYTPGDHFVTFEVKGVRCGLLICYDIRFPELYRAYAALGVRLMFHSFHNARQKEGSVHPIIMPATAQARAADHTMFISLNNSSAPRSWESRFITPDGLVAGKLALDEPGVMVNTVDPAKKYYDAAAPFRPAALAGKLNSGDLVADPRSTDRKSP